MVARKKIAPVKKKAVPAKKRRVKRMIDANDPVVIMKEMIRHGYANREAARIGRLDYDPKYCMQVVEFCSNGLSLSSFAGHIGVSRVTLYNWRKTYPEFDEAVLVAQNKALLFHDRNGASISQNGGDNAQAKMAQFYLQAFGREEFLPADQCLGGIANSVGTITRATSPEDAMRMFESILRGGTLRVIDALPAPGGGDAD